MLCQCRGGDVVFNDVLMLNGVNNVEDPRCRIIDCICFLGGRGEGRWQGCLRAHHHAFSTHTVVSLLTLAWVHGTEHSPTM